MKKFRPRVTEDEMELIEDYRKEKVEHDALIKECEEIGIPVDKVSTYWYKSKRFSINVKNKETPVEDLFNELVGYVKQYAPEYPNIDYKTSNDPHLLVIDPADIHLNKLARAIETGDEYNHNIAFKRVKEAVIWLLNRSKGYQVEKILLIIGNDILHVDTKSNTTTGGTHQDVSLMWYDAFKLAQQLLVECIEILMQVAPLHVVFNPSNHDNMSGFYLAQVVEAWFSRCSGISFDITPSHRKYYKYHNNLIGSTHGDGAREQDLPLLMAHESPDWSSTKHRYFYTHHIHHKKSKDYLSVNVEAMRSPSGADSWHHKSGYQHAPKGVDAFIHHPVYGRVAVLTHIFQD
jgi:hypothetical protein